MSAPSSVAERPTFNRQGDGSTPSERATMEWRPIRTAPKDREILLYGKCPAFGATWVGAAQGWWAPRCLRWATHSAFFEPTHWLPLPPAPMDK